MCVKLQYLFEKRQLNLLPGPFVMLFLIPKLYNNFSNQRLVAFGIAIKALPTVFQEQLSIQLKKF